MNDRFKFRAYNTESKRIYDVRELGFMRDTLELVDICLEKPNNDAYGIEIESIEEYIVMQCTGLKDKNGKFIYEGDIVELEVLEDFTAFGANAKYIKIIGSIIFDYGGFFIEQAENDIFLGQIPKSEIEVIGNIYETPELLEKNND